MPGLQDVQPHLQALDRKLFAVENMAGRHMAVDEMADMLGVAVPVVSGRWALACWACCCSGQHAGLDVLTVSVWYGVSLQACVVWQTAMLGFAGDATSLAGLTLLNLQQAVVLLLPAALQLPAPGVASWQ